MIEFLFAEHRAKVFGLLGALALGAAPLAPALAQETPPPASSSTAAPEHSASTRVDRWIAKLHSELKITPEQSKQWDAFTSVLRENAASTDAAYAEAAKLPPTATAVDDLKAYAQVEKVRSDNINKLEPAFETLYGALSESQKKAADAYFHRQAAERKHHH